MAKIIMEDIGVIHSPHKVPENTPIQPVFADDIEGTVEVFPEYAAGLKDIDGFSHIFLFFHLDRAHDTHLLVKPFLDKTPRGIFATRSPFRPNKIGMSVVKLLKVEGNVLRVSGLDILDGTPLLDIKPYTRAFDDRADIKSGWHDATDAETARKIGSRKG